MFVQSIYAAILFAIILTSQDSIAVECKTDDVVERILQKTLRDDSSTDEFEFIFKRHERVDGEAELAGRILKFRGKELSELRNGKYIYLVHVSGEVILSRRTLLTNAKHFFATHQALLDTYAKLRGKSPANLSDEFVAGGEIEIKAERTYSINNRSGGLFERKTSVEAGAWALRKAEEALEMYGLPIESRTLRVNVSSDPTIITGDHISAREHAFLSKTYRSTQNQNIYGAVENFYTKMARIFPVSDRAGGVDGEKLFETARSLRRLGKLTEEQENVVHVVANHILADAQEKGIEFAIANHLKKEINAQLGQEGSMVFKTDEEAAKWQIRYDDDFKKVPALIANLRKKLDGENNAKERVRIKSEMANLQRQTRMIAYGPTQIQKAIEAPEPYLIERLKEKLQEFESLVPILNQFYRET